MPDCDLLSNAAAESTAPENRDSLNPEMIEKPSYVVRVAFCAWLDIKTALRATYATMIIDNHLKGGGQFLRKGGDAVPRARPPASSAENRRSFTVDLVVHAVSGNSAQGIITPFCSIAPSSGTRGHQPPPSSWRNQQGRVLLLDDRWTNQLVARTQVVAPEDRGGSSLAIREDHLPASRRPGEAAIRRGTWRYKMRQRTCAETRSVVISTDVSGETEGI
jgi:hypothetical protein